MENMENTSLTLKEKIALIYQEYKNLSTIDFLSLREKLDKEIIPSLDEKTKNAEVCTPYSLIEEMLDKFPDDFWKNPLVKVFDPCCGKGGFLLSLFDRFFKGLENVIQSKITRTVHIISCILYFADISESNILIAREILTRYASLKCGSQLIESLCNSFICNSLGLHDGEWSQRFDAVIGNPPFNAGEHKIILWPEFVYRALEVWVKPGGYLAYVHPPLWRKPFFTNKKTYVKIFDLMTKTNKMIYLSINGKKDGWATFNCGTRFDHYLIQKSMYPNTKDTQNGNGLLVYDEDGNINYIDLSHWNWLPSKNFDLVSSVLVKDCEVEERCPILYSRSFYGTDKSWMSPTLNEENGKGFIHPCIHSTLKGGVTRYYYSKLNNRGFFGVPKVIFGESGIFEPILDIDGIYGMTHCAMAIEISGLEEGKKVVAALKSEKFGELIKSCCFSSFRIDWRMFIDFRRDFYLEFI